MSRRKPDQKLYEELSYYTLAHPSSSFVHQHTVDAFAAQHADEQSKPISLAFALIGLYLHIEQRFSGKDVQKAHAQLARRRKEWPRLPVPCRRGDITVFDVVAASPGPDRDAMIEQWCRSVWEAYSDSHKAVTDLVRSELYGCDP
jgi:hypothetical protein